MHFLLQAMVSIFICNINKFSFLLQTKVIVIENKTYIYNENVLLKVYLYSEFVILPTINKKANNM